MHCNLSFVIFVDMSANSEEICPQSEMIFTGILKNTVLFYTFIINQNYYHKYFLKITYYQLF